LTPRADFPQELNRPPTDRDHEAEYQRLLAYQTVDELRGIARRWDVKLRDVHADTPHPKEAIVKQLAARLCDPQALAAHINALDESSRHVLVYMHLTLAPEYGLSAENILRGLARQSARAAQLADSKELFPEETLDAVTARAQRIHHIREIGPAQENRRATQEQIAALSQQGLLLPFRQGSALYYALPMAVRAHLPPIPDLFAYTQEPDALVVDTRTVSSLFQALFVVWNTLAKDSLEREQPLYRQSPPARQPLEDQWATLRGWDHDPAEIEALARGRTIRGRSAPAHLNRVSPATLNRAMTIPAPAYRLRDNDLCWIREVTGCPDPEIEFYYVLLEKLGALSGAAGEPIDTHKEALLRFLRLPSADKVRTLWRAWALAEDWSEVGAVLGALSSEVRLRRSLAYPNYKVTDLYQEWKNGRQAVLRFFSLLPEGRWIQVSGFLGTVFQVDPNLMHAQTDPSVWWLESTKTGKQFGTTFEDWQQSYGRFVLAMIEGPLAWLGMVRLGYRSTLRQAQGTSSPSIGTLSSSKETRGTLEAFQLTPAGAFALGRRPTLVKENLDAGPHPASRATAAPSCVVNDDLTISLAPGRASLELHDLLHSVGRLLEATPERFLYRLTADRVFRWAEDAMPDRSTPSGPTPSGPAIETLIGAMAKYIEVPGAQAGTPAWQEKLRTWGRNYGRLHVYENLTLIELADDYALQELLVSTSLRQHLIYQFSPRLVAIRADTVEDLVQEMETRGYTPRVE
jgi:hypothetical protein